MKFLIENRDVKFDYLPNEKFSIFFSDKYYIDFTLSYGGGYFFNKALHIYGNDEMNRSYCLENINDKINFEYGKIASGCFFFACDIFGNQFCYCDQTNNIYLFDIESGNKTFVANNFLGWIEELKSETDYYTGQSIILEWEKIMAPVNFDERLTPKMPFIIGGEYHTRNLRIEKLDKILEFNACIAKQIYDKPDGTPIKIKID